MSQRIEDHALIGLLLLACATVAGAQPGAEQQVLEHTNALRKAQGVAALSPDARLAAAARDFAAFMAKTGKYGHAADGRDPAERAAAQGYETCIVSENIARLYRARGYDAATLAQALVEGWKRSPEHREAMLDPAVTQIGVGIARNDQGRHYGVQMFGRPKTAAIRFTVRNRSARAVSYRAGEERFSLAPGAARMHTVCRRLELGIDAAQPFGATPADGEVFSVVPHNGALAVNRGRRTPP
jgi:hypothetical protein